MEKKRLKIAEAYIKLDLEYNEGINRELEIILRKAATKSIREFKYGETLVYKSILTKDLQKQRSLFLRS